MLIDIVLSCRFNAVCVCANKTTIVFIQNVDSVQTRIHLGLSTKPCNNTSFSPVSILKLLLRLVVEVCWSSAIIHTVHNDTQLELNPPAYRQPVQL